MAAGSDASPVGVAVTVTTGAEGVATAGVMSSVFPQPATKTSTILTVIITRMRHPIHRLDMILPPSLFMEHKLLLTWYTPQNHSAIKAARNQQ